MQLTFIRHGTTAWNEEARYQGWTDLSLAPAGIREATDAAAYFRKLQIDAVISSDLARCVETAHIIFPAHPIRTTPEFRELSFGKWEGLTYTECLTHSPDTYSQWLDNPRAIVPPEGESLPIFEHRVIHALDTLIREYDPASDCHLAIVTHGGPIRFALQRLLGTPTSSSNLSEEHRLPPGGYVHVPITPTVSLSSL